jgi:hypothetical protein
LYLACLATAILCFDGTAVPAAGRSGVREIVLLFPADMAALETLWYPVSMKIFEHIKLNKYVNKDFNSFIRYAITTKPSFSVVL